MFTGLIADLGRVRSCGRARDGAGATVEIETRLAGQLGEGDSIAVNGVCLTATRVDQGAFAAQAMAETLRASTLGGLQVGARVNLELPLRIGDRLGGHIVQGHVDGIGTVLAIVEDGFAKVVRLQVPAQLARHLVQKGSVAIDGVSLTVSALAEDWLEVSLIPETQDRTTLGALAAGDAVNVEVDVLSKHVERLLASTLTSTR